ncbi:MAG TPA: hypothetical protein VG938_16310 [Verrucomicrobiae bacterium]|jgi:hypothetical protein|nr:hypothetical protein [Verrucomicrobiae bacterium]
MNPAAFISAEAALLTAYEDWRRFAELEGTAIRTRDWNLVTDCQKQISALQPRILRLTHLAREEWQRAGVDRAEKENILHRLVLELIESGTKNNSALAAAKEAARAQVGQLVTSRQNLKRVQRSYSPLRPALWNSFS